MHPAETKIPTISLFEKRSGKIFKNN